MAVFLKLAEHRSPGDTDQTLSPFLPRFWCSRFAVGLWALCAEQALQGAPTFWQGLETVTHAVPGQSS